jgi:valyl-tRNA synthetase
MGHMLEHTIIDVVIRAHRMRGDNTLWLPGMDHAGIATQMVVERQLRAQGIARQDLGREQFEERVWKWKGESGGRIVEQMKAVGASCDWSRERFTMDAGLSRAVRETFVRLWEKGLIYRGEYMVNWCPSCGTAISDLEVDHEETQGSLWHLKYPVTGEPGRFVIVATTRPETMLGDTAVAVHPEDERYQDLKNRTVTLPLMNREIPVIFDPFVDPQFGTGVVKVTPAHDPNDFEAGKRNNLAFIKVIDEHARITKEGGAYAGLDRFDARKQVIADLTALGLVDKIEPHTLSVGRCQRSKDVVEPLISQQWFCHMKPLAAKAINAVMDGRTTIRPENWEKIYFDWMHNIRDWCISRQLWWGHRIPAWHCAACKGVTVEREDPAVCVHCGSSELTQETDVLDTWFSSGLWPFSTLGWPDQTPDLQRFYPTSLMIMGYEILFFWCARMMMLGLEMMGDVPFRHVFIHGIVRNADRTKMSKTKGNTVDPLDITVKYGTDAVRLALIQSSAPGADVIWTEDKLPTARAFANKIWNASRFLFLNMERAGIEPHIPAAPGPAETLEDRWIRSRLAAAAETMNRAIDQQRFHDVGQTLWQFFWNEFCDWYVELKKLRFADHSGMNTHWSNLLWVFDQSLRLLHPAMPFITEELWQRLRNGDDRLPVSIAIAALPQGDSREQDAEAEREMQLLQDVITAARNLRAELKVDPKLALEGILYSPGAAAGLAVREQDAILKLANVRLAVKAEAAPKLTGAVRSTPDFDLVLSVPAAQQEAQAARLQKENVQLEKNIANTERQLSDEKFMGKAPEHVVASMRQKLADYKLQLEKNREALQGFS